MADTRDSSTRLPRLKWRALANLGDVQRGIASVVRRMGAGRLDHETGRAMIAGLHELGVLYTNRMERKADRHLAMLEKVYGEVLGERPSPAHDN